jgi:hypothetical protein
MRDFVDCVLTCPGQVKLTMPLKANSYRLISNTSRPAMTTFPTMHIGPGVDRFLATEGALAQAVSPTTVLVSSQVLEMSTYHRTLVILHELAHTEQLARPGNDPVQALENEAWEAAYAWMEGRYYQIRGRARTPLNAIAIVQGGPKGHPHAPPWYATSPREPISTKEAISVTDVTLVEHLTLESILDLILASKGATDLVIVCHGDGNGLALPLQKGSKAGAEIRVIFPMGADRPGLETADDGTKMATPVISDSSIAELTMLSELQVKAFRMKMNQVRSMKLKHVAFRACSMGIKPDTMKAFRIFFGAASVSAPKEFDTYGTFSQGIIDRKGALDEWVKAKQKGGFHIVMDGDVAFGTKRSDSALVYNIVAAAASKAAFNTWVAKHIADGASKHNGVIFHGIKALHPLPSEPSVYFVRDAAFISNIVNVAG